MAEPQRVSAGRERSADRVRSLDDARRRGLAWGVHAFTASGAVVGAVALLAIGGRRSLARGDPDAGRARDRLGRRHARAGRRACATCCPRFDGRRLDDMVDYLNYVIVPVGVHGRGREAPAPGRGRPLPILASAYGFSQEEAKTDDDFFLGFPSYWNVVALYLWLLDVVRRRRHARS